MVMLWIQVFAWQSFDILLLYQSGVDGSVGQPKASKPEVLGWTPDSSCVYQEFNKL